VRGGALAPGPRSLPQTAPTSWCVTVGVHGAVRARGRGYEPSEPENPMGWPERSHSGVDRGRRSKIVVLGSRTQRPCATTYNGPASARGHHNHAFGIVKRRDPISPQGDAAADGDFTSVFSMSTSTSSLSPAYPRPRPTLVHHVHVHVHVTPAHASTPFQL
jgi:hypothetical protein